MGAGVVRLATSLWCWPEGGWLLTNLLQLLGGGKAGRFQEVSASAGGEGETTGLPWKRKREGGLRGGMAFCFSEVV